MLSSALASLLALAGALTTEAAPYRPEHRPRPRPVPPLTADDVAAPVTLTQPAVVGGIGTRMGTGAGSESHQVTVSISTPFLSHP